jgi:hypothetical protein
MLKNGSLPAWNFGDEDREARLARERDRKGKKLARRWKKGERSAFARIHALYAEDVEMFVARTVWPERFRPAGPLPGGSSPMNRRK